MNPPLSFWEHGDSSPGGPCAAFDRVVSRAISPIQASSSLPQVLR